MVISSYVSATFDTILSYFFWKCSSPALEGGPAEVPGDELVEVGGQDGPFLHVKIVSADPPEAINLSNFLSTS
jgi:hypothetical protein